ncbi:MAG TPA: hypothetical protein VF092_02180 [Longimicrobium sp.]
MARKKKQYAPILEPACPPTHFTVEQARRAVLEVLEEDRLAEAVRKARTSRRATERKAERSGRGAVELYLSR